MAGAEFDPSGLPAYYGVLSAEALLQFGIMQKGPSCGGAPKAEVASVDADTSEGTVEEADTTTTVAAAQAEPKAALKPVQDANVQAAVEAPSLPPQEIEAALAMTRSDRVLVQQSLTALGFNTQGIDRDLGCQHAKGHRRMATRSGAGGHRIH